MAPICIANAARNGGSSVRIGENGRIFGISIDMRPFGNYNVIV